MRKKKASFDITNRDCVVGYLNGNFCEENTAAMCVNTLSQKNTKQKEDVFFLAHKVTSEDGECNLYVDDVRMMGIDLNEAAKLLKLEYPNCNIYSQDTNEKLANKKSRLKRFAETEYEMRERETEMYQQDVGKSPLFKEEDRDAWEEIYFQLGQVGEFASQEWKQEMRDSLMYYNGSPDCSFRHPEQVLNSVPTKLPQSISLGIGAQLPNIRWEMDQETKDQQVNKWLNRGANKKGLLRKLSNILMKDQLRKKANEERPVLEVDLDGPDGNIFALLGLVQKTLRKAGKPPELFDQCKQEVYNAEDYSEALNIIEKYVELMY